jgi:hypothetical protein
MPAHESERLSVVRSGSGALRYRWLNESSIGSPVKEAGMLSFDSPMSLLRAEKTIFFSGAEKPRRIFWKESEKTAGLRRTASKSFRRTVASLMKVLGMICA